MTPAECFVEAQRLLGEVSVERPDGTAWFPDGTEHANTLAAAQVFATLATVPPSVLTPPAPKPTVVPCDEYAVTGERCVRPLHHEGQHDMRLP